MWREAKFLNKKTFSFFVRRRSKKQVDKQMIFMANFRMSSIDEQLFSSPVGNPPAAGSNIFRTRLCALRRAGINLHKLVYGLARDTFVQVEPANSEIFSSIFRKQELFFCLRSAIPTDLKARYDKNSRSFSSISIALFIKLLSLLSSIPPIQPLDSIA